MSYVVLILVVAAVAANLPWLSERFLFVRNPSGGKKEWMRLLEWLLLYLVVGLIAVGVERKAFGVVHQQSWEFYVVTLCLFMVFAMPGFIYRHILGRLLQRR